MSTSDGSPPVGDGQLDAVPKWDLPVVAQDHLAWVWHQVELLLGPCSAYSKEEQARLAPGCQLFLDVAQDSVDDVLEEYAILRDQVTADLSGRRGAREGVGAALRSGCSRAGPGAAAQQRAAQEHARAGVRATLQDGLEEVVALARDLGVDDEELAGLLRRALDAARRPELSGDQGRVASVVDLSSRRRPSLPGTGQ